MKEIGILDAGNETYEKINKHPEEIIQDNLEYNTGLKLSNWSKDKSLPIMYWIPKLHKNPVGSRFLIASKNCLTKPLSKEVSNVFKRIYSQIENLDPVIENINIMNRKKKAKSIATYDLSTLYTTLPHDKLIKRLCNVIDFVFEGTNRTHIFVFPKTMLHTREKSPKTS